MRRGLSILLTMVLCLSLVACDGKSNEASGTDSDNTGKKTLTIALLPKTLSNPYFVAMQDFAKKKYKAKDKKWR